MICSIHQPNYIPYLWLFNKIKQSDVFVFYDLAQYTKWDYHNRNKIKWANWEIILTLPVSVSLWQKIKDVTFNNHILKKHLQTIEQSYKKADFYNKYIDNIRDIFNYKWNNISDFNIKTIKKLCNLIWIKTEFVVLSDIIENFDSKNTQALINICKLVWANGYLSWAWGKNYIEENKFIDSWIKLYYQDYNHPVYKQLWWDFISYMSIIDLIFNEGENSINFI